MIPKDRAFSRRDFCEVALQFSWILAMPSLTKDEFPHNDALVNEPDPLITDTFIHLFKWPFKRLKYDSTNTLVAKLRRHGIGEAWAGNFEALLHKNLDQANARLYEACMLTDKDLLVPIGSVNPDLPDWEEDLRRCDEVYQMPGIRIYPMYQMLDLHGPGFRKLVVEAARRKMFVQVAGDLEDRRHHHPLLSVKDQSFDPLLDIAKDLPSARIQLLHWNTHVSATLLRSMVEQTNILFDISRIEGAGELGRLIDGESWNGLEMCVPATRFLFGSHAPFLALEAALLRLFEHPIDDESLTAIMAKTAKDLYTRKD